jgi:hypothetical protein
MLNNIDFSIKYDMHLHSTKKLSWGHFLWHAGCTKTVMFNINRYLKTALTKEIDTFIFAHLTREIIYIIASTLSLTCVRFVEARAASTWGSSGSHKWVYLYKWVIYFSYFFTATYQVKEINHGRIESFVVLCSL